MKIKVQAQHLQPGDIVGSGEEVKYRINASIKFPASKVEIGLVSAKGARTAYWGKYTEINIERPDKIVGNEVTKAWIEPARLSPEDEAVLFATGHLPEDF